MSKHSVSSYSIQIFDNTFKYINSLKYDIPMDTKKYILETIIHRHKPRSIYIGKIHGLFTNNKNIKKDRLQDDKILVTNNTIELYNYGIQYNNLFCIKPIKYFVGVNSVKDILFGKNMHINNFLFTTSIPTIPTIPNKLLININNNNNNNNKYVIKKKFELLCINNALDQEYNFKYKNRLNVNMKLNYFSEFNDTTIKLIIDELLYYLQIKNVNKVILIDNNAILTVESIKALLEAMVYNDIDFSRIGIDLNNNLSEYTSKSILRYAFEYEIDNFNASLLSILEHDDKNKLTDILTNNHSIGYSHIYNSLLR